MDNKAFKAWLDAMPIDDVRHRIARLETKLADLRVLERIYTERHEAQEAPTAEGEQPAPSQEWQGPS